jgi:hypothetical protein
VPIQDFTPADGAEDDTVACWEALQPGAQVFRAPPGAVYETPAAELVALTPADDSAQAAALRKFNIANL